MKNSEGSMDFMGVNAVLENNPLYVNKDVCFYRIVNKSNYEAAKVTGKKLAVDKKRILKKITQVRSEAEALSFKLSRLKDVDNMTEYDIGCGIWIFKV